MLCNNQWVQQISALIFAEAKSCGSSTTEILENYIKLHSYTGHQRNVANVAWIKRQIAVRPIQPISDIVNLDDFMPKSESDWKVFQGTAWKPFTCSTILDASKCFIYA